MPNVAACDVIIDFLTLRIFLAYCRRRLRVPIFRKSQLSWVES
jgi:hypothetical protein